MVSHPQQVPHVGHRVVLRQQPLQHLGLVIGWEGAGGERVGQASAGARVPRRQRRPQSAGHSQFTATAPRPAAAQGTDDQRPPPHPPGWPRPLTRPAPAAAWRIRNGTRTTAARPPLRPRRPPCSAVHDRRPQPPAAHRARPAAGVGGLWPPRRPTLPPRRAFSAYIATKVLQATLEAGRAATRQGARPPRARLPPQPASCGHLPPTCMAAAPAGRHALRRGGHCARGMPPAGRRAAAAGEGVSQGWSRGCVGGGGRESAARSSGAERKTVSACARPAAGSGGIRGGQAMHPRAALVGGGPRGGVSGTGRGRWAVWRRGYAPAAAAQARPSRRRVYGAGRRICAAAARRRRPRHGGPARARRRGRGFVRVCACVCACGRSAGARDGGG
jgi:hypothetical protein